jgi:colicin import membrane protein
MSIATMARRIAGVSFFVLALALVGGCGAQDRNRVEQASQDNVSLKAQLTDLTQERDALKKELADATKGRDQYQKQMAEANDAAKGMQKLMGEQRTRGDATQIGLKTELEKTRAELDAAKKAQADAEQTAIRLKAAEDAVTAARAKAVDAEKAASTASDRVTQMTAENAALKQRLDALTAELAKKPAAPPDLNK